MLLAELVKYKHPYEFKRIARKYGVEINHSNKDKVCLILGDDILVDKKYKILMEEKRGVLQ